MGELKKHASLKEQVAKLASRGLEIPDSQAAEALLFNVNYYRLTGYLYDFKVPGADVYRETISMERLKHIYDFDRKLTRILMYALEDIEETLKTRLSYTISSCFPKDPLIYLKPQIYRKYAPYLNFLSRFYDSVENNKKLPFVKHHIEHYQGFLPIWCAVELFTMGNLHAVYDNLLGKYQKAIARSYGTGPQQLASWIENLTYTRNHLAHYMRIYNFNFGRSPAQCDRHHTYTHVTNMIFDQLYIISFMYSDAVEWNTYVLPEIKRLLSSYSEDISLPSIGFPTDWEQILRRTDAILK